MSSDKYYYNINIGDFNLIYYNEYKKIKFDCLAYKQYKLIDKIYQLVRLNVILKLFVSNRLKENVYRFKDMFSIISKAEKNKINMLELRIYNDTVYLSDIDASILQTYIERFLQKIDFIDQESIPDYSRIKK